MRGVGNKKQPSFSRLSGGEAPPALESSVRGERSRDKDGRELRALVTELIVEQLGRVPDDTANERISGFKPDVEHDGDGYLVSALMCMPSAVATVLIILGLSTDTWLCKPDDTCPLPTTTPIRLGSYINYFVSLLAVIPMTLTTLYAAAMRGASHLVQAHERDRSRDIPDEVDKAKLERKALKASGTEILLLILSTLYVFGMAIMWLVAFGGDGGLIPRDWNNMSPEEEYRVVWSVVILVSAMILLAVMAWAVRILRVALVRRHRYQVPVQWRKIILPRLALVFVSQSLLLTMFLLLTTGTHPVPLSSLDGDWYPPCPELYSRDRTELNLALPEIYPQGPLDLNSSYFERYCHTVYSYKYSTTFLSCDDGGLDRFPSIFDSCQAHILSISLVFRCWSTITVSLAVFCASIFPDYLNAVDSRLSWHNWPSKAAPRVLAAIISAMCGAAGSMILLGILLSPFTDSLGGRVSEVYQTALNCAAIGLLGGFILLALEFHFLKRTEHQNRLQQQQKEETAAIAETKRQDKAGHCKFWFVKASYLQDTEHPLPPFQELKAKGALQEVEISFVHVLEGKLSDERLCAISHRWEDSDWPDQDGVQTHEIKEFLNQHPEVELIWYDYWCMPQGKRTLAEKVQFKWMLQNINQLYLGVKVLILLDISYLSRFWTQFEAWLSMQAPTALGLRPAPPTTQRFTIVPIHNADGDEMKQKLVRMWATKTPESATATLAKPDVLVTNKSDKVSQLPKLVQLDKMVKTRFRDGGTAASVMMVKAQLPPATKLPTVNLEV